MIKGMPETIDRIVQLAREAGDAKLVLVPNKNPSQPQRAYLVCGGKADEISPLEPEVPARCHRMATVPDFVGAYLRWASDGLEQGQEAIVTLPDEPPAAEAAGESTAVGHPAPPLAGPMRMAGRLPAIWVHRQPRDESRLVWEARFFLDEPFRRSFVAVNLPASPQMHTLAKLQELVAMPQKALVRMLRHDLAGCCAPEVLAAFRSIEWSSSSRQRTDLAHQNRALDVEAAAALVGPERPQEIRFEVPLFAGRELSEHQARLIVSVDVDADLKKFELQLCPGQWEEALDYAEETIVAEIAAELRQATQFAEKIVILRGRP